MHGFSNSTPTRAAALPVSSGDLIADRRYAIAKDLEARGDLAAAADLLTQALERAPGFCVAWFAFAEVRERLGDRTGAAEAFRQALRLDPNDIQGAGLRLARLEARNEPMPPAYVRRATSVRWLRNLPIARRACCGMRSSACERRAALRSSSAACSTSAAGLGLRARHSRPAARRCSGSTSRPP